MDIRESINLVGNLLIENVLSRGSQQVMANKKMVGDIAKRLRRELLINEQAFPANFEDEAEDMSDQELAQWFLGELDKLETEGYLGQRYSNNGAVNFWLSNKYANGGHTFEDIKGKSQIILGKRAFLKNRGLLDPAHEDLQLFGGLKQLGEYLVNQQKYAQALANYEQEMQAKQLAKTAITIRLVDNNDYKITTALNQSGAIKIGMGTVWCTTSSSEQSTMYDMYSSKAMLFQIFPKNPEYITADKTGRRIEGEEKYQFDAGGPYFMDIADYPQKPEKIQEKFPYLYDDLVTALRANADKLEGIMEKFSTDETYSKDKMKRVKVYDIEQEIKKLDIFVQRGFMTKEKRPVTPEGENETPQPLAEDIKRILTIFKS